MKAEIKTAEELINVLDKQLKNASKKLRFLRDSEFPGMPKKLKK